MVGRKAFSGWTTRWQSWAPTADNHVRYSTPLSQEQEPEAGQWTRTTRGSWDNLSAGAGLMVWWIISWHTLGPFIRISDGFYTAEHLQYCFHHEAAPCHKAKVLLNLVSWTCHDGSVNLSQTSGPQSTCGLWSSKMVWLKSMRSEPVQRVNFSNCLSFKLLLIPKQENIASVKRMWLWKDKNYLESLKNVLGIARYCWILKSGISLGENI